MGHKPAKRSRVIGSRVQIHDKHQFEVKLDYSLSEQSDESRYRVEMYVFVPRSLGAHVTPYSREQFYSDLHTYIRFKTPGFSLESLLDGEGSSSPLMRLEALLKNCDPKVLLEEDARRISYDLRLLAAVARSEVRDRVVKLSALLGTGEEHACAGVDVFLSRVEELLNRVRLVCAWLSGMPKEVDIVHSAGYVDEYLSLTCEHHATFLLEHVAPGARLSSVLGAMRAKVVGFVLKEQTYRAGKGYRSVLEPGVENDHFVYRRGQLKKFVSSVLFLEMRREKELLGLPAVIAGVAAGVAMLVATLAAIFSQQKWGLNTAPFVLALVLSYIVKDRLKDTIKTYVSGKFTHWLWDYNVHITDPDNKAAFGRCRESVTFVAKELVPAKVLNLRHGDSPAPVEAVSKPEVVLKYTKDIKLNGAEIRKWHYDLHDINDLLRFNLSHFLARADDPMQIVRHYDAVSDEVKEMLCPKLYHINTVMCLRSEHPKGEERWVRVRMIVDRHGIRDLQELDNA